MARAPHIALVTVIFLSAVTGWCTDPAFEGRKAVIFPITDLSARGADRERQDTLSAAVDAEFQAAGFSLLPGDVKDSMSGGPRERLAGPAAAAIARQTKADVAVSGSFTVEDDQIVVLLSCYEAQTGALAAGFLKSWRYNLTFYKNLRSEIEDMLASLTLTTPKIAEPQQAPETEITFTSRQEGMEVLLGGERNVGTITQGKLVVSAHAITSGSSLLVEKRMAGYHTSRQTVRAGSEIVLTPLARKSSLAVEASWTAGEFLGGGAAARLYLFPDSLFLSAGLNLSIDPPVLPNAGTIFHFDTLVLIGQYLLFPPESPFRMGIATGTGTIFTTGAAAGPAVYTDVYWDVVSLWGEWNLPWVSIFLRSDMKYALGIGRNLLGRGILMWSASSPEGSGNTGSIRFPPLTLGVVVKL